MDDIERSAENAKAQIVETTASELADVVAKTAEELKQSNIGIASQVETTAVGNAAALASVVTKTAEELKQSNAGIALSVKTVADQNALALSKLVATTAEDLKNSNATLASDVKDTAARVAADVKLTAESVAKDLKKVSDRNAELGPLLLQSMVTASLAMSKLDESSTALKEQSAAEEKLLKGRSKYFVIGIILLTANLVLNVLGLLNFRI